jgi:hypothetical protein
MAIIVLSSPATLTGLEEKKTGPSRFNEDFWCCQFTLIILDRNSQACFHKAMPTKDHGNNYRAWCRA